MASHTRTEQQIKNEIVDLEKRYNDLCRESIELGSSSYSQSDPGAMMDRRSNRRNLESTEKKINTLKKELKDLDKYRTTE